MNMVDNLLNRLTMYRLLTFGLGFLAVLSISFSYAGVLSLDGGRLVISLSVLMITSFISNHIISRIWNVPYNFESWAISALVLFFILPPINSLERALFVGFAAVIAMASKYLISYQGRHIFNPAAFGVFVTGSLGLVSASWWVGSAVLWPFILLYGLLVARKIRRLSLVAVFIAICITGVIIDALVSDESVSELLKLAITASPLLFLGTIMLTEPSTMPPTRRLQLIYGSIVAALYIFDISFGGFTIYPETALLIGNIFAFAFSPKRRLFLRLKKIEPMSDSLANFVFESPRRYGYKAGQYMEWTLPPRKVDIRGNRRSFSLASSPTEDTIQIGVKFAKQSSSFKRALRRMKPGDTIYAGQLSGDFTLPKDTSKKIVMVAGGIGITPFRSMLTYIMDTNEKRDIVLFYLVANYDEVAYKHTLARAKKYGINVTIISKDTSTQVSNFDVSVIEKLVPDYKERLFYISGSNRMITNAKKTLKQLGISKRLTKTDYFSGY